MRYIKKIINTSILEYITVPFVMIFGGFVLFFVYISILNHEIEYKKSFFNDGANERINLVALELQKIETFLKAVASVNSLNLKYKISAHDLISYSKRMRKDIFLDLPLFVAPKLMHKDRSAFESINSLLYGDAKGVVKVYNDEQTHFIPAPNADIYYPIRYVASFKEKDLASIAFSDWKALSFDVQKLEEGQVYTSLSRKLVQTSGEKSIVMITPLYLKKLHTEPEMLVVTRFIWSDLFKIAFKDTTPAGIDLRVTEITKSGTEVPLYEYISRKNIDFYDVSDYDFNDYGFYMDNVVNIGEKHWKLSAYPTAFSPYDIDRSWALYALWLGLFLLALLVKLIQNIILQKNRTEVLNDTKELEIINRAKLLENIAQGDDYKNILDKISKILSHIYPDIKLGIFYADSNNSEKLHAQVYGLSQNFADLISNSKVQRNSAGEMIVFGGLNSMCENVYQGNMEPHIVDVFRQERIYGACSFPIHFFILGKIGELVLFLPRDFDWKIIDNKKTLMAYANLCALSIGQAYCQYSKRDVESRFKALSEHESNLVAIFDKDLNFKFLSQAFARALGCEMDNLVGGAYSEIVYNSDRFIMKERLDYALGHPGEEVTFEISPKIDGYQQTFWEVIAIGMPDVVGVEGIMINCREITAHKKTEADLQKSARTTQVILDNASGAILRMEYITESSTFNPVFLSDGWEKFSGCDNSVFLNSGTGKDIWDIIHPSDFYFVKEKIMDAIIYQKEFSFKMRVISQDTGAISHLWCQGISTKSTRNLEHKTIEIVAIDLTENEELEERLKVTEKQLNSLIDSIPGSVFSCHVDENRTLEYIDSYIETISGVKAEEFKKNPEMLSSLIHKDDLSKVYECVRNSIDTKESFNVLYRLKTIDGTYKYVREYAKTYKTDKGVIMLEGIIFEINDSMCKIN